MKQKTRSEVEQYAKIAFDGKSKVSLTVFNLER